MVSYSSGLRIACNAFARGIRSVWCTSALNGARTVIVNPVEPAGDNKHRDIVCLEVCGSAVSGHVRRFKPLLSTASGHSSAECVCLMTFTKECLCVWGCMISVAPSITGIAAQGLKFCVSWFLDDARLGL